jgi:ABC-type iron transport system FetAB ATPase subunit
MLTIEQLSSPLLATISFQLEPGECICIHGPSGSGKTLLLRAIADLDVNSGTVRLDNRAREDYSPQLWRQRVTYLPAESHWWSSEVKDHFSRIDTDFSRLDLPREIGNWKVDNLSSGERQRLALLRALDHDPQVLLLDEVSANLDEENTGRVEQLIRERLASGLAVIWVSHDKNQRQRMATRSYRIQNGHFSLDSGSHATH